MPVSCGQQYPLHCTALIVRRRYIVAAIAFCILTCITLAILYWHVIALTLIGVGMWRYIFPPKHPRTRRGGTVESFRKWIDTGAIALIAANTYPVRILPASVQRRVKARGARA